MVCKAYYHEEGVNERVKMFERIFSESYTTNFILTYKVVVNGTSQIFVIVVNDIQELAGCTYNTTDSFGERIVKCGITKRFFKANRKRFHNLCTYEDLKKALKYIESRDSVQYNEGYALEYILHEKTKQQWTVNTTPYTKGADIIIKGIPFQIKSYNGTFTVAKK